MFAISCGSQSPSRCRAVSTIDANSLASASATEAKAHTVIARCASSVLARSSAILANVLQTTASDLPEVTKAHVVLARPCSLNICARRFTGPTSALNNGASGRLTVAKAHAMFTMSWILSLPTCSSDVLANNRNSTASD
eukprot:gnl/TRDRNA2_/TRDRNA2_75988_c1_seq1.p1 gnl/TRDRNA2_/TRDRNA2_75988_c1~~gnl/TRDRNA2_/TRDRNA2_75988_c1_seq1.p1  ORF type:complete len:139 (-),score=17.76 gnl/TRDRNA2_/TRDRNA2_75988_c1_seq1:243-659(-)